MELKDIVAISGKTGLFKVVGQTKTGAIVESLIDGKRQPVFIHDRLSSLADITVFTTEEDRPLRKILQAIRERENGGPAPSHKSDETTLKNYFATVVPDYDNERVYFSAIKKIISWYNLLHEKGLLDLLNEPEEKDISEENSTPVENPEQ
ncbi:MAG TPA: DUF5606 domain-containing protein [Bacteroidales bacterium]|jgi:hypothetical protein|nr:DUF5606 domain-containing protein [Bacteroidales bacterium]MDI9574597.1 DUF5606 domain-containing protein [Bacteroidota bacterium]OQC60652.1 MAG: hypothetical protein BWX51_00921 [Bacteroidetes bacterium ADurb.Bin012]MBP9512292.1 DUF5606 domain-containing protein [Bacteroidales bacterium]MBP9588910.1 DUF5606 domain-containing protein [Bacteroidales bacterium]